MADKPWKSYRSIRLEKTHITEIHWQSYRKIKDGCRKINILHMKTFTLNSQAFWILHQKPGKIEQAFPRSKYCSESWWISKPHAGRVGNNLQMKGGAETSPHNIMHPDLCSLALAAEDFHQWNTPNKIQWHCRQKIWSSAHKPAGTWTYCLNWYRKRKNPMTWEPSLQRTPYYGNRPHVDGLRVGNIL